MHPGIGVAALITAAAAVTIAAASPAAAQPVAPGGAYQVIANLENQGYDVNIDRVGSAPIDQCIVTSVRNPQDVTRTLRVANKHDDDWHYVTVIVRRYVTVSLNCTR